VKREGSHRRPPISRELRKRIQAEREWIEKRGAEKRRLFFATMKAAGHSLPHLEDVDALGSASRPGEPDGGEGEDDPYSRFVPVGDLIGIDELADAVSEEFGPAIRGAFK
jgi:hypothetical protein